MHCLRWWLPIFLLPLPAASPFLALLFVATYAVRTRPCAYCSVIILGLMFSACALYSYVPPPSLLYTDRDRATAAGEDVGTELSKVSMADSSASLPPSQSKITSPAVPSSSSVASSCWIDLSCGFLTESDAAHTNQTGLGLGWWSAPTRRWMPTVLREKNGKKRQARSLGKLPLPLRPLYRLYESLTSDGIWIGLDNEDAGFRLKLMAD